MKDQQLIKESLEMLMQHAQYTEANAKDLQAYKDSDMFVKKKAADIKFAAFDSQKMVGALSELLGIKLDAQKESENPNQI